MNSNLEGLYFDRQLVKLGKGKGIAIGSIRSHDLRNPKGTLIPIGRRSCGEENWLGATTKCACLLVNVSENEGAFSFFLCKYTCNLTMYAHRAQLGFALMVDDSHNLL